MEPDNLDSWLDKALTQYNEAAPRSGLEYRVLANLKAEETRRVTRRWWRAVAAAMAVTAAVFIWVEIGYWEQPRSIPMRNVATQSAKAGSAPGQEGNKPGPMKLGNQVALAKTTQLRTQRHASLQPLKATTGIPKLDQFPSHHPLSQQEKLLLAYAQHATEPVSGIRFGKPLENLEIPPLNVDEPIAPPLDAR